MSIYAFFDMTDELLSTDQAVFLGALKSELGEGPRPYCLEVTEKHLLLVVDIDAPNLALFSVGLEYRTGSLRGDRISIHDRNFPSEPTPVGFVIQGSTTELAAAGARFLQEMSRRPIVKLEWLYGGRTYADCYMFKDTGERLAQMYRSDWAPPGEEEDLVARGFVYGQGWPQTHGLRDPDRVIHVRGDLAG